MRQLAIGTAASVLALVWAVKATCPAVAEEPQPSQYVIELKLAEVDASGKQEVLSRPVIVTLEGQTAHVQIGQSVPSPAGLQLEQPLQAGTRIMATILRKDGRLFLDAETEITSCAAAGDQRTVLTKTGVRTIEAIRLGEKAQATIPNGARGRRLCWEARVRDARDCEKIKAQRTSDAPGAVSVAPPCPAPTAATASAP